MPAALCADDTCLSSSDHAASLAKSSSLHTVVTGAARLPTPSATLTRSLVHRTDSVASGRHQSGWYNSRKTYRSVAFGTWQVGSARQLFSQNQNELVADEEGEPAETEALHQRYKFRMYGPSVSFDGNRNHAVRPQRVVPGGYHTIAGPSRGPSRHRQPHDSTTNDTSGAFWRYSSRDSGFSTRSDVRDTAGSQGTLATSDCEGDCFSADDYKRFHRPSDGLELDIDASAPDENDSEINHNVQTVMDSFRELHQYASLRRPSKSKRYGKKRPQLFGHKRSHSAGNAILFSVRTPTEPNAPNLNNVPATSSSSSGGVGAFQATKNFLKRLYQSTTSREASTTAAVNKKSGDGGTDTTTSSVDSGYHGSDRFAPSFVSVPSLAVPESDLDCSDRFAPVGQSVPSLAVPERDLICSSPPLSPPPRQGAGLAGREFKSWNDVFDHLRREITTIRERDMHILREFQQLEGRLCELRTAKRPVGQSPIVEVAPNLEHDLAAERCLTESMPI